MGAEIKTIKKGLLLGIGFVIHIVFLGFVSALFAVTLNTFASGDLVRAAEINANFTALKDEIVNAAPDNAIMAFYLATCPNGWIPANGAAGSGTPDLRGMFIRGLNDFEGGANTRGDGVQDPDGLRMLAAYQGDQFAAHTHGTNFPEWARTMAGAGLFHAMGGGFMDSTERANISITSAGGNETRPRNVGLIYCMRQQ